MSLKLALLSLFSQYLLAECDHSLTANTVRFIVHVLHVGSSEPAVSMPCGRGRGEARQVPVNWICHAHGTRLDPSQTTTVLPTDLVYLLHYKVPPSFSCHGSSPAPFPPCFPLSSWLAFPSSPSSPLLSFRVPLMTLMLTMMTPNASFPIVGTIMTTIPLVPFSDASRPPQPFPK